MPIPPIFLYIALGVFACNFLYTLLILNPRKKEETPFEKKLFYITRIVGYAFLIGLAWNLTVDLLHSTPSNNPEWSGQSHYDPR